MSREDFYEAIRQKVLEYLPASEAERRAEIHTITKNNGVTRQALCIFGESVIVPNIYLEDYYKQHLLGRGTEDILGEIALVYCHSANYLEAFSSVYLETNSGSNSVMGILNCCCPAK